MEAAGEVTQVDGPNTRGRDRRQARIRAVLAAIAAGVVACGAFVVITGYTGFPGPGSLRRYPNSELQALADQINALHCVDGSVVPPPAPLTVPIASAYVDRLASRVRIRHAHLISLDPTDRQRVASTGTRPMSAAPACAQTSWTAQG
jgi:hypothetical protein